MKIRDENCWNTLEDLHDGTIEPDKKLWFVVLKLLKCLGLDSISKIGRNIKETHHAIMSNHYRVINTIKCVSTKFYQILKDRVKVVPHAPFLKKLTRGDKS